MNKEIRYYCTQENRKPFLEWCASFKDKLIRARIKVRLDRMMLSNYGDYKFLGDGIYEMRIHCGVGYRIYFAEQDKNIVVLLCGGSKQTQTKDIEKAKKYWSEFRERYYD